jgi:hypothetical protein
MTASASCEDGYMCLEYTRDQYSYPAQPGTHISSATAPQVEDDCTDNYYCEGGTNTGTECPAGYLSMESTTKLVHGHKLPALLLEQAMCRTEPLSQIVRQAITAQRVPLWVQN